jgi:hypothetical protein
MSRSLIKPRTLPSSFPLPLEIMLSIFKRNRDTERKEGQARLAPRIKALEDRVAFNHAQWEEYGEEEDVMFSKFKRLILIDDEVHVVTATKERRGDTIGECDFDTTPFDDFMEMECEEGDGTFSCLVEDFELLYAHAHKSYTYRMIKKVITEFELAM